MNTFTLTRRDLLLGLATLLIVASLIASFGQARHKQALDQWGQKTPASGLNVKDALFYAGIAAMTVPWIWVYSAGARSRRRIVHFALALRRRPASLLLTEAATPAEAARLAMSLTDQIRPIDILSAAVDDSVDTGRRPYILEQARAIDAYQREEGNRAAQRRKADNADVPEGEACLLNIVAVIPAKADLRAPVGHPTTTATRAFQSLPDTAPDALYLFTLPESGQGVSPGAACRLQAFLTSTVRKS